MALEKDLEEYLRHIRDERQLSEHTLAAYSSDLSELRKFLTDYFGSGEWSWGEVDRLAIRAFLSHLTALTLKRRTIARKLSAVRSFFRFLHREGRVRANPARQVKAPRLGRTLPGYLTQSEMSRLFELIALSRPEVGWRGARDRALLELLYSAGLRLSEVHGLSDRDVDHPAGSTATSTTVRVRGKGNVERIVPVGRFANTAIRDYVRARDERFGVAGDAQPLFVSDRGARLSRRQIQRIVTVAVRLVADESDLSTHSIRHSFATHLLDEGADLMAIKELLGHASLSTTRMYAHTSRERVKQVHRLAHPRG